MNSKHIQTFRCNLVPVAERDYANILSLYTNLKVRQYLGGKVKLDDFPQKFNELIHDQSIFQWVAKLKGTGDFVGLFSLGKHHDGLDTELSYQLMENMQGKGLALEITKCLLNFAFTELGLKRLIAETQTANAPSIKLLEKIGMKFDHTLERFGAQQSIYVIDSVL
jgi:ribosomal-protein-alanine N-acetyltransferase